MRSRMRVGTVQLEMCMIIFQFGLLVMEERGCLRKGCASNCGVVFSRLNRMERIFRYLKEACCFMIFS